MAETSTKAREDALSKLAAPAAVMDVHPHQTDQDQQQEQQIVTAEDSIPDLPADALQHILACVDLASFVAALMCSKAWQQASLPLWRQHALQRWQQWPKPLPPADAPAEAWRAEYQRRHELDRSAQVALQNARWPQRREAALQYLVDSGSEVQEALAAAAVAPGAMDAATRYWARIALVHQMGRQHSEAARAAQAAGGIGNGTEELLQWALRLSQLQYPLVDVAKFDALISDVAAELKRRMEERKVTGGRQALELLNALLFQQPAASNSAISEDLFLFGPAAATGPDPSMFLVPSAGGLGLQGDQETYESTCNSIIPDVLRRRQGLPMSLGMLHAAVGSRAGLPLRLLPLPGHVMTELVADSMAEQRFIDVFEHGRTLDFDDLTLFIAIRLANRGAPEMLLQRARATGGPMLVARMYSNLYNHAVQQQQYHTALAAIQVVAFLESNAETRHTMLFRDALPCWQALSMYDAPIAAVEAAGHAELMEAQHVAAARAALERERHSWLQDIQEHSQLPSSNVHFRIGDVVQHRKYNYKGVIQGWNLTCAAGAAWIQQMGVLSLPHGEKQPFYNVLVDVRHRPCQTTYVAQDNIKLLSPRRSATETTGTASASAGGSDSSHTGGCASTSGLAGSTSASGGNAAGAAHEHMDQANSDFTAAWEVRHPDIGQYFEGWDAAAKRYVPVMSLSSQYPSG